MTVVSSVILFDTGRFNSSVLLRGLAYQVGLSLREAQLFGVAVKETGVGTNDFSSAYGVYFPSSLIGVRGGSYPLFIDLNANGVYDDGVSSVIENYTLQNYFIVASICGVANGAMQCVGICPTVLPNGVGACTSNALEWLVVSFHRPDPDAILKGMTTFGTTVLFASAIVTVESTAGSTRAVSISSTGQIVVEGGE